MRVSARGERDLEVSVGLALRGRGIGLAKVQKVMVLFGQLGAWVSLRFFFVGAVGFNVGSGDCSDRRPGQGWGK